MNARFGSIRLLGSFAAAALVISACGPAATVQPATSVPTVAATTAPTLAPTIAPTTAPTLPPAATATAAATATTAPTEAPTAEAGVLATTFQMNIPWGLAVDADGTLYVSTGGEPFPTQIVAVDSAGLLKVIAGLNDGFTGDGGPAITASFTALAGIAVGPDGSLYVADQGNNRIRRIDQDGVVSTVAGSGPGADFKWASGDFAGDGGPAIEAALSQPTDIAFDQQGNLYIADHGNNRVRKVDPQGVITTFAGTGEAGFSGDGGPATEAQLNAETFIQLAVKTDTGMSLEVDAAGNVYIGDNSNFRIRKVDPQGIITTIAGTGEEGFSGDGGPATAAQLSYPSGLAVDAAGNLYFSDGPSFNYDGQRIRKIDPAGFITTIAGVGEGGFSGDGGPATAARIQNPVAVALDAQGNLYFVDYGNHRVRKIDNDGIITTVAGNGS